LSFVNTEQAEFWSERAQSWFEFEDLLNEVAGPPGRLAMDRLGLLPGQKVLDLGCGTGGTTMELASRVGPEGEVVGADIAAEMLVRAKQRAQQAGASNVSFIQADVQVHDLGEGRFDAAFSRFGVMFFADPVAAFANVRKALKPEGTLSFVCWQGVFENEWMLLPGAAVMGVIGSLPPLPGPEEPGPFSLAEPDRVRAVLEGAGFVSVDVASRSDTFAIEEPRIEVFARSAMQVGALREALKDADDETRSRSLAAIEEAIRSRLAGGEAKVSRGVHLVVGHAG